MRRGKRPIKTAGPPRDEKKFRGSGHFCFLRQVGETKVLVRLISRSRKKQKHTKNQHSKTLSRDNGGRMIKYRGSLTLNCEGTKSMSKLVLAKVLPLHLRNLRDLALRHMRRKPSAGYLIFHPWVEIWGPWGSKMPTIFFQFFFIKLPSSMEYQKSS